MNLFDIESAATSGAARNHISIGIIPGARKATNRECLAYLQWLAGRAGLPPMEAVLHKNGATFGGDARGGYEAGAYSIPMPGRHQPPVTMDELDEAGNVVRTITIPVDAKGRAVIKKEWMPAAPKAARKRAVRKASRVDAVIVERNAMDRARRERIVRAYLRMRADRDAARRAAHAARVAASGDGAAMSRMARLAELNRRDEEAEAARVAAHDAAYADALDMIASTSTACDSIPSDAAPAIAVADAGAHDDVADIVEQWAAGYEAIAGDEIAAVEYAAAGSLAGELAAVEIGTDDVAEIVAETVAATAQVIDFTAALNARRANAERDRRAAVDAERKASRRVAIHQDFADAGFAGAITAGVAADLIDAAEEKKEAHRPMPAYCDPDNETRGSRHDATRNLSLVEVAKRMRGDIKLARKAGHIPAGVKVSVRVRHGAAIDVRVTAVPAGMKIWSDAYLINLDESNRASMWRPFHGETYAPEFAVAMNALKSIHAAYNRDNSDSMTDYFDIRYYGNVGIDWTIESELREAEMAAALATAEGR